MITSEQLLNYQLTKAGMNGYKAVEVDELITSAAETVSFYEKKMRELQRKLEEMKKDENIIQTTLVNAQKLANQITEEAQTKADAIISEATKNAESVVAENESKVKESSEKAESSIREMIDAAKKQANAILESAKNTAAEINAANAEEQDKQKKLLTVMKNEVAEFRNDILRQYKEHVQMIDKLPHEIQKIKIVQESETNDNSGTSGSNLVKILGEMKDNENAAVSAVEEVAELTSEEAKPDETAAEIAEPAPVSETANNSEESVAESKPAAENKQRAGGFKVMLDDEE